MRPSLRLFAPFVIGQSALTVNSLNATFPYRWLRDACQCPACVHPSTRQKLHRTTDVALHATPATGGIASSPAGDAIDIRWEHGHTSSFPLDFLRRYASAGHRSHFHRDLQRIAWDRTRITHPDVRLYQSYTALKTEAGLLAAISQLWQYGLLFVTGVSTADTSDEGCELRSLAGLFSEIRPTFYGETWDVKSVRQSKNIAYTNLNLGLHMDLLSAPASARFAHTSLTRICPA
jgi:gamma-butyrobetaine dioxygenase